MLKSVTQKTTSNKHTSKCPFVKIQSHPLSTPIARFEFMCPLFINSFIAADSHFTPSQSSKSRVSVTKEKKKKKEKRESIRSTQPLNRSLRIKKYHSPLWKYILYQTMWMVRSGGQSGLCNFHFLKRMRETEIWR